MAQLRDCSSPCREASADYCREPWNTSTQPLYRRLEKFSPAVSPRFRITSSASARVYAERRSISCSMSTAHRAYGLTVLEVTVTCVGSTLCANDAKVSDNALVNPWKDRDSKDALLKLSLLSLYVHLDHMLPPSSFHFLMYSLGSIGLPVLVCEKLSRRGSIRRATKGVSYAPSVLL